MFVSPGTHILRANGRLQTQASPNVGVSGLEAESLPD